MLHKLMISEALNEGSFLVLLWKKHNNLAPCSYIHFSNKRHCLNCNVLLKLLKNLFVTINSLQMSSVVFMFHNIDFLFYSNIQCKSVQTEQPPCASVFRGCIRQLLTLTQNKTLVTASPFCWTSMFNACFS